MTSRIITGMPPLAILAAAFFLILYTPLAYSGDESGSTQNTDQKQETPSDSSLSGMKAATVEEGGFRPTTDKEERELGSQLRKTLMKYPAHEPKFGANGSISLVVAPHRLGFTVASIGPDGKVSYSCADGLKQMDEFALATTSAKTSHQETAEE